MRCPAACAVVLAASAAWGAEPLLEFPAADADQGVAVDAAHVYVIDNTVVAKHDKCTGALTARWEAGKDHPLIHMNAGIVHEGKLYCAHSNYPFVPMTGSVEIWDAESLTHLESRALPEPPGSLTWFLPHEGAWWACFAHYGHKPPADKNTSDTVVVKYDADWKPVQSWSLPRSIIDALEPYSLSGGSWGDDGLLYVSGHDGPALYAMTIPEKGTRLRHVRTLTFLNDGQATAFDPSGTGLLYGILRKERRVVAAPLRELELRDAPVDEEK